MSDVSGNNVNYNYDSLSQLLSEARQFAGLSGTYTIAYQYNLAGQLKMVTDQSAGTSFSYALDKVGRLSTITSTGLGASTALASNAQYRASGAPRQWTYGNGTGMSLAYNNRGLIAQYSLSGVKEPNGAARAEGSDYQYHADGQVKFASDFYGRSFSAISSQDKSYQQDQAGRLQVSLSGVEANDYLNNTYSGSFHGAAPYLQSYTHDAWNNLLTRDGSYWTETDTLEAQTYDTNNRNSAWSYDADGRLMSMNEPPPDELPFVPTQHTYDAAGRHVKNTQTTSRVMPLPGNPVWTTVATVDASYDGDGQQCKRVETKQISSQQSTIVTRFLLRSSVLGGEVITDYDGQGVRQKSYVVGGGTLITSSPSEGLIWRFNNPVTGDGRETDGLGKVITGSYLDAEGVDVGATDPADNHGDPPPPDPLPRAGAYAAYLPHSLGGSGRCSVDEMETACGLVNSLLAGAADEECPNDECTRYNPNLNGGRGGYDHFHAYADGRSFYLPGGVNWTGDAFTLPGGLRLSFVDGIPNSFKNETPDPQKPIDWSVLQSALQTCINKLWDMFEMTSFTPASAPSKNGDDSNNGVIGLRDNQLNKDFKVVNDTSPPSNVRQVMINTQFRGITYASDPFWTYSYPAADFSSRPGELRYPELFKNSLMTYVRVQIHETGAALSLLRNMYHPGPWAARLQDDGLDPQHPDDGPSLEDCVGKEYYKQMGLTPHNYPPAAH